ncbi:MAG: NADPH-dependent oxidoreductase [Planctomycetota bacterium]|nr:MAG: NADPH-dependent oxidoreductase [Planctomycetota bacterium]
MFVVVSGSNRPGCNTIKVARRVAELLRADEREVRLLDLRELPPSLFAPESYAEKPADFAPFQEAIDAARGILTVVPEYNGSFPGALKYFVDMLRFPESLADVPCAFVGLSAGRWGGVRAVEQLEQVFLYRHAQPYGRRVFLPDIFAALDDDGRLVDPALDARLAELVRGFGAFVDGAVGRA